MFSHLESKINLSFSSEKRTAYKNSCNGRKDEIRAKISKLQQRAPCFIDAENDLEMCIQNIKKLNNNIQLIQTSYENGGKTDSVGETPLIMV